MHEGCICSQKLTPSVDEHALGSTSLQRLWWHGKDFALAAADFYMSLYNVVFTALTPLIVGTMDSDVNREMSRKYPGTVNCLQMSTDTVLPRQTTACCQLLCYTA